MPSGSRAALREALLGLAPWLAEHDVGPRAVDAGACPRCREAPRLLPTCGPGVATALCRECAESLGEQAWCEGHRDEGRRALIWARGLPERWADHVVWWWVATGELRVPATELPELPGLPPHAP